MNQNAIRSGLIIGVIGIIISLLLYIVDVALFANWWLIIILGVVNLILITVFGIKYRNENGGFITFKESYIYSVISMIVLVLIGTIFSYVLFNIVNPDLPEIIADIAVENAEAMMEKFETSEDIMDEAIEKSRQDTLDGFTPAGILKGGGIRILVNLAVCLIIAAIIKKNKPEEAA
ncbi:MAG: DUF4199 domain-containing protein [Ekhidna sp.]|nr:DUF4199 domain-containing protein [Ekhidna sp.]